MYKDQNCDWTKDAGLHPGGSKTGERRWNSYWTWCCPTSKIRKPNSSKSVYGWKRGKNVSEHSL